jgi:hypothetical protein
MNNVKPHRQRTVLDGPLSGTGRELARVLDVTYKLSMMPRHSQQQHDLALPLNLTFGHELFQERYAGSVYE